MNIESRWALLQAPNQLKTITATLKGKLPASRHALCDMLDAEASRLASAQGLVVLACAGGTVSGEVEEVAGNGHVARPSLRSPGDDTLQNPIPKVPTLSRDYWACPKLPS